MNSKIVIPVLIVISAIIIAVIVSSLELSAQSQITQNKIINDDKADLEIINDDKADLEIINDDKADLEIINDDKADLEFFDGTNNIKKISSQKELEAILKASSLLGGNFYGYRNSNFDSRMMITEGIDSSMLESSPSSDIASTLTKSQSGGGSEYSTTNIQVQNVDEPDYLKNDSKYVYIVSQNTLSIIDAYPAESAKLILKVALDIESQYIENMFLNDDRLVIFYNGHSDDEIIPQYDFVPRRSYDSVTHALILDVSNKEHPTILKDYSIDGHFRDARMIGDYAYFVTNTSVDYQHPRLPIVRDGSVKIITPDVFYFDNVEEFSNFNTLTAIDIFGDKINSESFLMGYSGTFYVSENNFYLTYQQNIPSGFYEKSSKDRFFGVIVPLLPNNIQEEIELIQKDSLINSTIQWIKISELMQEFYNQMDKNDKDKLFEKIRDALNKYDVKIQKELKKTIIHKISIDEDKINYVAKGSVPGRLLNQFSMDESDDRFRVATTTEHYIEHQGIVRANAVYVLDKELKIVGGLDEIAINESIFSARFIEDRLYLVTFKQIDPFFVIDLSSDTPKILGELKIPGFSNYLHPYDKEHIIGFGRDTKETGGGRVQQLGIKIALFNVVDVNNPKVADEVIIGDGSTDSAASHDHKAFFFDKKSGILSIPISGDVKNLDEISSDKRFVSDYNRWSGFYVFDLNSSDGFNLKGTVLHLAEDSRHYGIDNPRTFFIDEVLYTASKEYLQMSLLDSLEGINSIKIKNSGKIINYIE